MAAGLEPPRRIVTHAHWMVGRLKVQCTFIYLCVEDLGLAVEDELSEQYYDIVHIERRSVD